MNNKKRGIGNVFLRKKNKDGKVFLRKKNKDGKVFLRKKNKKGFEMIWSTWVVMILAIVLVIFLVLFFTMWSENFLDNIKGWFSKTNVDSVAKGCNILVQSGESYNFCCDKKEVKYLLEGEVTKGEFSCSELVNKNFVNNEIKNEINCAGFNCSAG